MFTGSGKEIVTLVYGLVAYEMFEDLLIVDHKYDIAYVNLSSECLKSENKKICFCVHLKANRECRLSIYDIWCTGGKSVRILKGKHEGRRGIVKSTCRLRNFRVCSMLSLPCWGT